MTVEELKAEIWALTVFVEYGSDEEFKADALLMIQEAESQLKTLEVNND